MHRPLARFALARCGVFAAAVAVCSVHSTGARAQDGANAPEALRVADLVAPILETEAMVPRWSALRFADDGSDTEREAWEQLRAARLETGVRALPLHSAALVADAADALGRGDLGRATQLLAWADELDPAGSEARFVEARMRAAGGPLRLPSALGLAAEGWQRRLESAAGRQAFESGALRVLAAAAALLVTVLVGILGVRRIGQLAFDVRLLLARGPTLGQAHVLLALGLAVIGMTTGSPALLISALVAASAVYAGWQERAALLLVCGVLAGLPHVVTEAARTRAVDAARIDLVASAPLAVCDADCAATLASDAGDDEAALALAWVRLRNGSDEALAEAHALMARARASGTQPASTACLAGSLAYLAGDPAAAERAWRDVLAQTASSDARAAAAINLARRLQANGDRLGVAQAFEVAEQLSPGLAAQYRTYAGRSQNRMLAACALDAGPLWAEARAEVDEATIELLAGSDRARWLGRANPERVAQLPAALAVWVILWALLARMGVASGRCRQCGTPTSRFIYRRAWLDQACIACYQLGAVGPQLTFAQRHARERRAESRRERQRRGTALLGLLVPGGGLLGRGQALAGMVLLAPACVACALLAMRPQLPTPPHWLPAMNGMDGIQPVALLVLGGAWTVSAAAELVRLWRSR